MSGLPPASLGSRVRRSCCPLEALMVLEFLVLRERQNVFASLGCF